MFRADAVVQFERWLHQQQQKRADEGSGGQQQFLWSKVELRPVVDDDGESMGYGIFAREDIRLNETAIKKIDNFEVPERVMITAGRVADIGEYAAIMQRAPLDPSEVLALFFCFERVHFDYFCEQPTPGGPFSVQWSLDIPPGFAHFIKMRRKRRQNCADDKIWWRPYLGILPLRFGTPLFRHYLRGSVGEVRLLLVAAKLPQEAKNKLLGQLAELKKLEKKLFFLLYASKFGQKTFETDCDESSQFVEEFLQKLPKESVEFWREMCCWAWHVVNTRCIFVSNLPFHPLVDRSNSNDAEGGERLPRRGEIKKRKNWRRMRRTKNDAGGAETAESYGNEQEEDEDGDYGGSLAIIPLVDMLNHSADAQCVALFDHRHSRHYLVRADQHFVPAGRQLFVCYGAHDNARLWIEYGFTIKNECNPFSRVPLPCDLFIALAERCGVCVSKQRAEVLRKANLSCTIYATDEMPSFSLRKSCEILLLKHEKLQNWSRFIFEGEEQTDEKEMELLASILGLLREAIGERKRKCAEGEENGRENGEEGGEMEFVASLWEEQIEIVRRMERHLRTNGEGTD